MSGILLANPKRSLGAYKRRFLHSQLYSSMRDSYRARHVFCHSPFDNIYHCCTQRTASQWFRAVFDDACFVRYTGLSMIPYAELGLRYADLHGPYPTRSIIAHLYVNFPAFDKLAKPERYFAFFILRDPRDIVTSWYFAARYSHRLVWPIPEMREVLSRLNIADGFNFVIDQIDEFGTFDAQRSWINQAGSDARVLRYEEFAADNVSFLRKLFGQLCISMPEPEFEALCRTHSFESKTGGRPPGEVDVDSHYRIGVAGDWQNHFTPAIMAHFRKVTGDTLGVLGYE